MSTIMRKMTIISRCERMYRSQQMSEEIPGFYHSYVLAICRNPGMRQETLARHLCFNKSSVTRHLVKLEKDGLVERIVSKKDKRELLVYPTDKMLKMRDEVVKITGEWNNLISEAVSEEEKNVFYEILEKISARSQEIVYPEE